jgi:arylsulfatase
LDVWRYPLIPLRVPKIEDLRADPFERGEYEGIDYDHWMIDRGFLFVPAQAIVAQFLMSFREFPPRQRPASFGVDQAMEALQKATGSAGD